MKYRYMTRYIMDYTCLHIKQPYGSKLYVIRYNPLYSTMTCLSMMGRYIVTSLGVK